MWFCIVCVIMLDVLGVLVEMVSPVSVEMLVWELLAFSSSLLFFKDFDRRVQETEWFQSLLVEPPTVVSILRYRFFRLLLDMSHHYWVGVFLNLYVDVSILNWIGAGIFLADIPDFIRRLVDMVAYMGQLVSYINGDGE